MTLLKSCCCIFTVKLGSVITGFIFLILCIVDIGVKVGYRDAYGGVAWSSLVFDLIFIIFNVFLIIGAYNDVLWMCALWVVVALVYLLILLIQNIVATVTGNSSKVIGAGIVQGANAGTWIVFVFVLLIMVYGLLVVVSHCQNLRDEEIRVPRGEPPAEARA
ncbi:uncharacterized protein LOC144884473 [Branchiostoma floridae x Branchiostoma japonicum]